MDRPPPTREIAASDVSAPEMYLLLRDAITPRPIAWVSTIDVDGRSNLAPYSFFNVCSPDPPILGFSVGGKGRDARGQPVPKDTLTNIRANGEMVINIVPESMMLPMVETSANLGPGESEFDFAKLPEAPATTVRPPRVAGAPVAYECRVHSILELGGSWWVMGEVKHVHVDERVYIGAVKGVNHRIDLLRDEAMRPVGRLGRALYARIRNEETILRRDGPND
ncbi:MAG: flavin reductase family protein [Burkholderiaceae bacterium]|jgi:flavin reductase (DIM6/NTAB) family NADH-FMN oxidoreductase RutF